jgi:phosphoribosylformylglycinamidine synthase
MAILGGCGARLEFDSGLVPAVGWFSESASRVVLSVDPDGVDGVLDAARSARVPAAVIGDASGDRIVSGDFDVAVTDATRAWRDAIPRALEGAH